MNSKTKLDLGFAVLSVEIDRESDYPAAYIGLCDKSGVWLQDIACVRMGMNEKTEALKASFETLVFSDKDDEDYTHKIKCNVHRDYYLVSNEDADYNLLVLSPSAEHAIELAADYAKTYNIEGLWRVEYLTSEDREINDIPNQNYSCEYVLQDEIFELENGVLFLEELGIGQEAEDKEVE